MIKITIEVDEDQYEKIKNESQRRRISVDALMIESTFNEIKKENASNDNRDFNEVLENTFQRNKEIYKKLSDC